MTKEEITKYIYGQLIKELNAGNIKNTCIDTIYQIAEYASRLINDYKVSHKLKAIETVAVGFYTLKNECKELDIDVYFWENASAHELYKLELLSLEIEKRLIERIGIKKIA